MVLPTGHSQTNQIDVSLPTSVVERAGDGTFWYRLHLQKQAGLDRLPFLLKVRLPAGAVLQENQDGFKKDSSGVWTWSGVLEADRDFRLGFTLP